MPTPVSATHDTWERARLRHSCGLRKRGKSDGFELVEASTGFIVDGASVSGVDTSGYLGINSDAVSSICRWIGRSRGATKK